MKNVPMWLIRAGIKVMQFVHRLKSRPDKVGRPTVARVAEVVTQFRSEVAAKHQSSEKPGSGDRPCNR
jgi:hypothetical protein